MVCEKILLLCSRKQYFLIEEKVLLARIPSFLDHEKNYKKEENIFETHS